MVIISRARARGGGGGEMKRDDETRREMWLQNEFEIKIVLGLINMYNGFFWS